MGKTRKLYVMPVQDDVLTYLEDESYVMLTPSYALTFSLSKPPVVSVEVTKEDMDKLPMKVREWLVSCIVAMAEHEVRTHPKVALKAQYEFLDEFEKELEIERKKWEAEHGAKHPEGEKD